MNDQPITTEEQDDAAFRARLAPLASEVLPPAPVAQRRPRRPVIMVGGMTVIVGALVIAGVMSKWPRPVVPVREEPVKPVAVVPDPTEALLVQRGDAALADGDIMGARLMFERAAGLGSAAAATGVGKTYDIEFLLRAGARGIQADQAVAASWYRKAAAMGDAEARARLARIETRP
jgi:hypothetical protein